MQLGIVQGARTLKYRDQEGQNNGEAAFPVLCQLLTFFSLFNCSVVAASLCLCLSLCFSISPSLGLSLNILLFLTLTLSSFCRRTCLSVGLSFRAPKHSADKALCRAADVDAECTVAAMAVLEREGRFPPVSSSSSFLSSYPPSALPKTSTTPAPVAGGGQRRGGRWSPPEVGVDFRRFVAAVRAVLLFEGERVQLHLRKKLKAARAYTRLQLEATDDRRMRNRRW